MHCHTVISTAKASNKVLPLYIKRCGILTSVTMRVYVARLVVFTTRAGENLSSWQALADVLGNEIQGQYRESERDKLRFTGFHEDTDLLF